MPTKPVLIGEYTEGHLIKTAKNLVAEKTVGATIFDDDAEALIPPFEKSGKLLLSETSLLSFTGSATFSFSHFIFKELLISRVAGRGGFCVVNQIDKVTLLKDGIASIAKFNDEDVAQLVPDRNFMATYCIRKGKDPRYAIKQLSDDSVLQDHHTYVNGLMDLGIEARFLAVIHHPNIIKMRAVGVGAPYSRDFFIVLDRLYDILTVRLITWKKRKPDGLKRLIVPTAKS
jgi:hypothetical protein